MDNLPLPFLLGYPFFINKGAIFDLDSDIPSVSLCKTDSQPTLQLISTADKASSFIFPFPNDFFAGINSAFINEASELPDFEQLFQEFYTFFLQGDTRPFDDILTEHDNEPSDLDSSSSSGSLEHSTNHAQLFVTVKPPFSITDACTTNKTTQLRSAGKECLAMIGLLQRLALMES